MKSPRKRRRHTQLDKASRQLDPIDLPKEDNMDDLHLIMVFSWFLCSLYTLTLFNNLDISLFELAQISALWIAVGFLIPIKIYRRKFTMSYYEYVIFNLIALAPFLCAAFLFINITFKGPEYTETHKITNSYREEGNTIYNLEDSAYHDKKYLRTVEKNDNYMNDGKDYLKIRFSDGLFGIRLIEGKSLH